MQALKHIIWLSAAQVLLSGCLRDINHPIVEVNPGKLQDCTVCHDATDTSLATGAHAMHLKSGIPEMRDCNLCHPDNEIAHSAIDSVVLLNDLTSLPHSRNCDSCHSTGVELAKSLWHKPAGQWKGDTANCKICHEVGHAVTSGAHQPHFLSKMGAMDDCILCHPDNIEDHTDIDSIVVFENEMDLENSRACDSCHTSGAELAKAYWNEPPETWKTDTSYCKICHAVDLSLQSGAHEAHIHSGVDATNNCGSCHPDNLEEHSDYDSIVEFTGGGDIAMTASCDTCHGTGSHSAKDFWNRPSGSWKKDTGYCMSCHDGSSFINGRQAKNQTEFEDISGHGFTGLYPQTLHGQNGPGYECQVCHDPDAVGHLDSARGDLRLTISNANSELCLDCHRPGQTEDGVLGHKAVSQASRHAGSVTGKYTDVKAYDYECLDCHGAHGTSNLAMVLDTIDGGLGAGPYPVTFTDSTHFDVEWINPDSSLKVDGTCDVCHIPDQEPHAGTEKGKNHERGNTCWNCHLHTVSFDTMTTYLSEFWLHPKDKSFNRAESLSVDIAEIVQFSASAIGNLDEKFDVSLPPFTTWSNNNSAVFVVSDSGKITGLTQGSAPLFANYSSSLGAFSDTLVVSVTGTINPSPENTLTIIPLNPTISQGETLQLTAQVALPGLTLNMTDSLTWASNNSAVVSIGSSPGQITGVAPGFASILAYNTAGLNATVVVIVQ